MANQPGGNDGIFVPVNLDTSAAVEQFDKLKETVKSADLRPNADLEAFFSGTASAVADTAKEIEAAKKKLLDMKAAANATAKELMGSLSAPAKFQMNMAAMAAKSYRSFDPLERTRAFSNEYQRQVSQYEQHKQGAYELGFQNRYLQSELDDGSYRKQVRQTLQAEAAEKKLMMQRDKMLRQTRLIERQERYGRLGGLAAHIYGENRGGFQQAGQMAGRFGMGAGVGVAALTASGFNGTVEGERFAREMRVLSLELAAAFKPLMDGLTDTTRRVRKNLQSMSPNQQDRLQQGGLAAAGAYLGSRFGPVGVAAGAIIGGGVGEGLRRGSARERGLNDEFSRSGYLPDMDPEKRLEEIQRRRDELTGGGLMGKFSITGKRLFGEEGEADELAGKLRALDQMKQATEDSMKFGLKKIASPEEDQNRRKLMITEGTGFTGAGSTFFALQEDLIRTTSAENATQTQVLERIANGVENLNK